MVKSELTYHQRYYQENKERLQISQKKYRKEYYQDNKEVFKEKNREYYLKHKFD